MKIDKARIKLLIRKMSLKQKDVAGKIGVTPQDLNNWLFRGVFTQYNKLEELANLLNVNVDTLLVDNQAEDPEITYGNFTKQLSQENLIPVFELDTQFGLATFWLDQSELLPKDFVYLPGVHADFVFPYYGKGMEPQIEGGDWIALRKISDLSILNYGAAHTIVTREQVIVRAIHKAGKASSVLLKSHNEFNDPIEIEKSMIKAIYLIVAVLKRNIV